MKETLNLLILFLPLAGTFAYIFFSLLGIYQYRRNTAENFENEPRNFNRLLLKFLSPIFFISLSCGYIVYLDSFSVEGSLLMVVIIFALFGMIVLMNAFTVRRSVYKLRQESENDKV